MESIYKKESKIKYKYIESNESSVTLLIDNETVVFEQKEEMEREEYSTCWSMDGCVEVNGKWIKKYEAFAYFEHGSDDFEQINEIEKLMQVNRKNLNGTLKNGNQYRIKTIVSNGSVTARLDVFVKNEWHYELQETYSMIDGYIKGVKKALLRIQKRTGIELIKTAKDYGLNELATEMQNDL